MFVLFYTQKSVVCEPLFVNKGTLLSTLVKNKNPSIRQTLLHVQPKKDLRLMSTRESESLAVPFVPLDKDGYF